MIFNELDEYAKHHISTRGNDDITDYWRDFSVDYLSEFLSFKTILILLFFQRAGVVLLTNARPIDYRKCFLWRYSDKNYIAVDDT